MQTQDKTVGKNEKKKKTKSIRKQQCGKQNYNWSFTVTIFVSRSAARFDQVQTEKENRKKIIYHNRTKKKKKRRKEEQSIACCRAPQVSECVCVPTEDKSESLTQIWCHSEFWPERRNAHKMMPPVRDDQDSSMDSRSSFMMAGKSSMDMNHLHQQSQSHEQLNQLHQPSGSPSAIPNHIGLSKAELRKVPHSSNPPVYLKSFSLLLLLLFAGLVPLNFEHFLWS